MHSHTPAPMERGRVSTDHAIAILSLLRTSRDIRSVSDALRLEPETVLDVLRAANREPAQPWQA